MPDQKASSVLKWMLGTHIIFGVLLVVKLAQGSTTETHLSQFESDTRAIERLLLDPESPAITYDDRHRLARILFPNVPESDIKRMIGAR